MATIPIDADFHITQYGVITDDSLRRYGLDRGIERCRESLNTLLQRPWFTRAWILQEIALARCAIVQCGPRQLSWDAFAQFARSSNRHALIDTNPIDYVVGLRVWHLENFQPIEVLLSITRSSSCRGPRDKLYYLLGIMHPNDRALVPRDYDMSVAALYTTVAHKLIQTEQRVDLLSEVQSSDESLHLPSWVPDWSIPPSGIQINSRNALCHASKNQGLALIHSKQWNRLVLAGKPHSVVTVIGELQENYLDQSGLPPRCRGWMRLLLRHLSRSQADSISMEEAFLQHYATVDDGSLTYFDAFAATLVMDKIFTPGNTARADGKHKDVIQRAYLDGNNSEHKDIDQQLLYTYRENAKYACRSRRFFVTDSGHIGLAPVGTNAGDQLCIFFGGHVPYVLRGQGDHHKFIGECYVHGIMDGEAMTAAGSKRRKLYTLQ